MIVSAYGFADVLGPGPHGVDPSRVAAQVVSGIGFLGAGLIFVCGDICPRPHHRRDRLDHRTGGHGGGRRAAGAGGRLDGRPTSSSRTTYPAARAAAAALRARRPSPLRITYLDGRGVLREALARVTGAGFDVSDVVVRRATSHDHVTVRRWRCAGKEPLSELVTELGELDGVVSVHAADANADPD